MALLTVSVCTGSGMLDIGFRIAVPEARSVVYVEREASAAALLVKRMQKGWLDEAPLWSDLGTFDGRPWRGVVDCLIGGYPCQPFSRAGRRKGAADERHLWPHIARVIDECRPWLCFFENVPGHVSLGLPEVAVDLRRLGFVLPRPLLLEAAAVGAAHRRERLFILAYHQQWRLRERANQGEQQEMRGREPRILEGCGSELADSHHGPGRVEHQRQPEEPAALPRQGGRTLADSRGRREPRQNIHTRPGGEGTGTASTGGAGEPVGNSECSQWRQDERTGGSRQPGQHRQGEAADQSPGRDGELGHSRQSRLAGRQGQPGDDGQELPASQRAGEFPLFAPGPSDPRWPDILREYPYLAPAIRAGSVRVWWDDKTRSFVTEAAEPGLRVLADGLAVVVDEHRVQQLRLGGNGVVALQAAMAFRILWNRLIHLLSGE